MPLYEYKCHSCGKTFEVIQKFADEPLKVHAECGGGPVERLLSAPAFHLKGSGWYVTDYGKGSAKPGKSDEAKSETRAEKSDTAKPEPSAPAADSKPAATTESKPSKPSTAA